IDGASTHKSEEFQARLEEWEARGLYIYLLPAYRPELNLIEILWRMIKYDWLPIRSRPDAIANRSSQRSGVKISD
ncbi:MAG: transposase, partial [Chloracidobacterium sp.]|nr:transposase [Chloracidobacterium sp.]